MKKDRKRRLKEWRAIRRWVDKLSDKLNLPIDPGVRDLVTTCNAMGLRTTMSCIGHYPQDRCPTPYITLEPPTPDHPNWDDNPVLRDDLKDHLRALKRKLLGFLEEFYHKRKTPYHAMLKVEKWAKCIMVENNGRDTFDVETPKTKNKHLRQYQREFLDFSRFLKRKFLNLHYY